MKTVAKLKKPGKTSSKDSDSVRSSSPDIQFVTKPTSSSTKAPALSKPDPRRATVVDKKDNEARLSDADVVLIDGVSETAEEELGASSQY